MIAVVIPYFQKEPGVLRRALASVAAQRNVPGQVAVVVVDDASPAPARDEIDALTMPPGMRLHVVEQKNGGPGAARNAGLAFISQDTQYVAFLDSDDEWTPQHLARAVTALEQGYDLYFADHLQLGQNVSALTRAGRIDPSLHPLMTDAPPALHCYQGDMFDQILRGNVVGTSTVVYRFANFKSERFRIEFTTAGEDYLFWMKLVTSGARTAFSSEVEAVYGKGVNVYSGSGWGTEAFLLRVSQEIRFRKAVIASFSLNEIQRKHVAADLGRLREAFLRDVFRRLRHGQGFPHHLLRGHSRADPQTWLSAAPTLVKALAGR